MFRDIYFCEVESFIQFGVTYTLSPPKYTYHISFSGTKVFSINPTTPQTSVSTIYGMIITCFEEGIEGHYVVLKNNRIYKLNDWLTVEQTKLLFHSPQLGAKASSMKLLKTVLSI